MNPSGADAVERASPAVGDATDRDLAGRVALVSGAARGIGLATARLLAVRGAEVVLSDLDGAGLEEAVAALAAEGLRVEARVADVRSGQQCAELVESVVRALGGLHVLVNCAGIHGPTRPLWETTAEEFDAVLAVNLMGTFNLCRAAVPHMLDDWGRIVNVASIAGKEGNPSASAYSSSKAAVIALTKSLGKELADRGVLVNAVAPAAIETGMIQDIGESLRTYMISRIPMGRVGAPEEVAEVIGFLASPRMTFATGAVFDVSGGRATY